MAFCEHSREHSRELTGLRGGELDPPVPRGKL
jgi:hypothetical protein